MKFFINNIAAHSAKANKVSLSFVEVEGLPKEISFQIFAPKSIELKEGEVNDLPHWLTKNIWTNEWVWKDLVKQVKKMYHKRAEKIEAVIRLEDTLKALKEQDVEEPIEETGEFIGKGGDTFVGPFKVVKILNTGSTTYEGVWQHRDTQYGCFWGHPTVDWCLWELTDMDGHCIILKCNNAAMNDQIEKMQNENRFFQMKATITGHNVFHGVRQTKIHVRKQNLEVFE